MLVKEIVYMVLDLAKAYTSDDSFFTEDHIIFLLKKYRSFLIKKEIDKQKTLGVSDFEYQQLCLNLEKVPAIDGTACTGGYYLRSKEEIPKIIDGTQPRVYPVDFYQGIHISYVSRDKMRYVGTNKFLQNILYVSLGPDLHLYLKSNNPQFFYLKKLKVDAVFEDFEDAQDLQCDTENLSCDILDRTFPIREHLVPTLIELVVQELVGALYKPQDEKNNASDDLSKLQTKKD